MNSERAGAARGQAGALRGWGGVVTIEKRDATLGKFGFFLDMFCNLLVLLRYYSVLFYSLDCKWLWLLDSLVCTGYPHVPLQSVFDRQSQMDSLNRRLLLGLQEVQANNHSVFPKMFDLKH